MNKVLFPLVGLALACSTHAVAGSKSADAALQSLTNSVAAAEQAILEVRTTEAFKQLAAAAAQADLTIAVAQADATLREISGMEAVSQLAAAAVSADLTLAAIDAQQTINGIGDDQLLGELEATLAHSDAQQASDMIMAVVSERPTLAATVHDRALAAGLDEALVASAVTAGFSEAAATAAGK